MGILGSLLGPQLGLGYHVAEQIQEKQREKYKSILVDADQSLNYLNQIRAQKEEALRQKTMLEQLSVQTEGCWAGESGDALRKVLANAIAEQGAIAKDLEDDATIMMQAIQSLIDTDEKMAELIRGTQSGSSGGGRRG